MIVTEKEAATKACARDGSQTLTAGGRLASCCIGSRCMAWQWDGPDEIQDGIEQYVETNGGITRPQFRAKMVANQMRPGFCGLAGKP